MKSVSKYIMEYVVINKKDSVSFELRIVIKPYNVSHNETIGPIWRMNVFKADVKFIKLRLGRASSNSNFFDGQNVSSFWYIFFFLFFIF